MLSVLGFGMVITFMTLIMTKRLSPLVALTIVPVVFVLLGGFGGQGIGAMMLEGIRSLSPTGVMLMFAILYFGVMIDAGLFDPLAARILRAAGHDPMKVVAGTAILAVLVSLDGDGSTTYMIVVAAMLPLYKRLGLDPLKLTCVCMIASGEMNLTPWGGPLARAASALHVDPSEIFRPMIPAIIIGALSVIALGYWLGLSERRRLGYMKAADTSSIEISLSVLNLGGDPELKRPRLFWFNATLTGVLMIGLIAAVLPLPVLFMLGFAVALIVNYPKLDEQRRRVFAHGPNVLAVVSLVFAAGVFTGLLKGTGMVEAMSQSLLAIIPEQSGPYLAVITAVISLPFTFFISNDAFYFGVMPILTETAGHFGITPAEMARASLIGQPVHFLSPLVPSTYLLVGLAGVEFGDHQRFTFKWAVLVCLVLLLASLVIGIFPFQAG